MSVPPLFVENLGGRENTILFVVVMLAEGGDKVRRGENIAGSQHLFPEKLVRNFAHRRAGKDEISRCVQRL